MSKIDEFYETSTYSPNLLVCSPVMKIGWNVKDYNGLYPQLNKNVM